MFHSVLWAETRGTWYFSLYCLCIKLVLIGLDCHFPLRNCILCLLDGWIEKLLNSKSSVLCLLTISIETIVYNKIRMFSISNCIYLKTEFTIRRIVHTVWWNGIESGACIWNGPLKIDWSSLYVIRRNFNEFQLAFIICLDFIGGGNWPNMSLDKSCCPYTHSKYQKFTYPKGIIFLCPSEFRTIDPWWFIFHFFQVNKLNLYNVEFLTLNKIVEFFLIIFCKIIVLFFLFHIKSFT